MQEFHRLLADIEKEHFAPVYLLSGTEPYFIDTVATAITKKVVTDDTKDFDYTVLYGKETSTAQILEAVKRYPMLGKYHLVVVKEAQNLDRHMEELSSYFENPLASSILVICYKGKAFDKRKKVYKATQKKGAAPIFKSLYDNQIPNWIQSKAVDMELSIAPKNTMLLAECLGSDLSKIERELEKLKLIVQEGGEITEALIEEQIGFSKEFNNFELQNAIGTRQFSKAYQIVRYMAQNPKNHPLTLTLSTLHSFFQKLLLYQGLTDFSQAANVLGVNPYFIKNYQQAARNFSMKQTGKALHLLLEADLKSKGIKGQVNHLQVLEELLLKLFKS